jgi:hypothetical protein
LMVDREELRQLALGQFHMPMSPAQRRDLRDGVLSLLAELEAVSGERDQLRALVGELRKVMWNWCNGEHTFACPEVELLDRKLSALEGEHSS